MLGPIPFEKMTKHQAIIDVNHDTRSHENFAQSMHFEVFAKLMPGNKKVYYNQVEKKYLLKHRNSPKSRQDIRKVMNKEPFHQFWSALRRTTQEMMWVASDDCIVKTEEELIPRVNNIIKKNNNLQLNSSLNMPKYITSVDIHCMPGGYCTEARNDDVYAGALYDRGVYSITQGFLGPNVDAIGQTIISWLLHNYPNFAPTNILDIGCAVGHSTLPFCNHFPNSKVVAIDVSAPMLRYAAARAQSFNCNVDFIQMNAEELDFSDNFFDLVVSSATLHELSTKSLNRIISEIYRVLTPGGRMIHVEQPQYKDMPLYDQFMRDWDTFGNNEPFWGTLHDLDLEKVAINSGFSKNNVTQSREFGDGGHVYNVDDKKNKINEKQEPNWFFYAGTK
tara:strand:+ start:23 stop:1195 length:1173 start_codon:yes stop_codon:yes gene_type:complete